MQKINQKVLMSGVDYFAVEELNPYSHKSDQPSLEKARVEFQSIKSALESCGVKVIEVGAAPNCQDGIYTANWGLTRRNKVVLSSLPNKRDIEQPFAKKTLQELGFETIEAPYLFSGQGDSLPCGKRVFMGQTYRTDQRMHAFVARQLGFEVVSLETLPVLDASGKPEINSVTGWPNSFFYDLDLALAIIREDLIAWCPAAFTPESQEKIRSLSDIEKIEVSYEEAVEGFACNLVSTGETVVMSATAPQLESELKTRGLQTLTPEITELAKGGGYIRCTTLTLDNR